MAGPAAGWRTGVVVEAGWPVVVVVEAGWLAAGVVVEAGWLFVVPADPCPGKGTGGGGGTVDSGGCGGTVDWEAGVCATAHVDRSKSMKIRGRMPLSFRRCIVSRFGINP